MTASPHPVDLYVGNRVRMRRKVLGITQATLAGQLGLTFQQVQKYERGANRISASMLFEIAQALACDVNFFFAGVTGESVADGAPASSAERGLAEALAAFAADNQGRLIAASFLRIGSPHTRAALAKLAQSLAGLDEAEGAAGA